MNPTKFTGNITFAMTLLLAGCSTAYVDKSKSAGASTPLQDAVFFEVNPEYVAYEPNCINVLPFTDAKGLDKDGNFRKAFHAQLSVTGVRLIPLQAKPTPGSAGKPDCELELRGKVLENGRLFLGVYSEYRVATEVELYDLKAKKYFWRAHHTMVKRSGGLPLDVFSALAGTASAAMNLESAQTGRVTFELADRIVKSIPNLGYREDVIRVAASQPGATQGPANDHKQLIAKMRAGSYAEVIDSATKMIETNPTDKPLYTLRAQAFSALGNTELAIKDYIKTIALGDESEETFTRLGSAYGTLGRFDLAVATYDRVLQKNPSNYRTLLLSGVAQAADGDPDKAYEALRRVLVMSLAKDDLVLAKRAVNAMHSTGTYELLSDVDKQFVANKL